jgi:hypothetical protein
MISTLCHLLECDEEDLKQQPFKVTSEKKLIALYRDKMTLFNILPMELFRKDDECIANSLAALGPRVNQESVRVQVSKKDKVRKHLIMHGVITDLERASAIAWGKSLKRIVDIEFDPLPTEEQNELLLLFLMWWSNRVAYCRQPYRKNDSGVETLPIITRQLQGPMCSMHGNGLRMSEQILTRLAQHVEDESHLTRAEKNATLVELSRAMNSCIGSDTTISITTDENGSVNTITMSAVKMAKQMEIFTNVLVPIAFSAGSMPQTKRALFEAFGDRLL